MGLVLTTEAMRVVKKNERGVVTYRKRYRKGQVVDTSAMDQDRIDALVASGALVDEDDLAEDAGAQEPDEGSGGSGDTPGDPGEAPEGSTPSTGSGDGQVGEPIPDLENMSYTDLKALAKSKDLDTSGDTTALVNRLTDYYTS